MTGTQRDQLSHLLERWVEAHPMRTVPTIAFFGRSYSPEEVLEEVSDGTEFGEGLGDFLYQKAEEFNTSVEAFIFRAIENNNRRGNQL